MGRNWARVAVVAVTALSLTGLAACGTTGPKADKPKSGLFGLGRDKPKTGGPAQIGVNGYLWRASLDTLAFMPLASADPYGGVIITDWYSNPETPSERFKATVYILDTRLRADGLNVTIFKQVSDGAGGWVDQQASAQTETDIENAILTRARLLRLANVNQP
ncbi:hypothetical protein QO010_003108 [Caulobacter ginsengisoli]|uniref:DUF3576 domain-containing protein n=2 Tax=Caulobacter ginsengisoli TaxID=400775 RepID=A0ABU0ITJ0_9CAUL|nr:DUF3576 domain-containing protein [Caulobacter ginsengisoli]MDQ0465321.1 hypothetical protein [Caulobacter ginsengisoli]